jgi:hypothetical protein
MRPEELPNANKPSPADAFERRPLMPREAAAGDASTGDLNIIPPSKTHSGGEDWLEVSLYLEHREFGRLAKLLDKARKAAEEGRKGDDEIVIGGRRFLVRPVGASAGKQKNRIYYRWQLQAENGLILQLMNRDKPHATMPNGSLRATSLLLTQIGAREVWRQATAIIDALKCNLTGNKLSRVDPCVDLPRVRVTVFSEPFAAGQCVTRARALGEYINEEYFAFADLSMHRLGRIQTGFVVGRDGLCLRIYDKIRESNNSPEKLDALIAARWGEFPRIATRVEYQIRRERLKQFGVDAIEDWFAKRAEICQYLCCEWFRLTDGPVDHNHADRSAKLPAWTEVGESFAAWTGSAEYGTFTPLRTSSLPPSQLLQQVIGLFVSYYAKTGFPIDGNEAFGQEAMCGVLDLIEGRDMAEEVRRRALELGVIPKSPQ